MIIENTNRKKALLVEDNADDEALTLRALGLVEKTDVSIVRDGVEALDYFFANGRRGGTAAILPDLKIIDIKLPKLNGLEVLRELRGNEVTRPIIG